VSGSTVENDHAVAEAGRRPRSREPAICNVVRPIPRLDDLTWRDPRPERLSISKETPSWRIRTEESFIEGPGKVQVEDIPFPKLELDYKGQHRDCQHGVILKVVSTNICGSDQHMVRGRTTAPLGLTLGHEITGEVIEWATT